MAETFERIAETQNRCREANVDAAPRQRGGTVADQDELVEAI
jgi:hypothetical protein